MTDENEFTLARNIQVKHTGAAGQIVSINARVECSSSQKEEFPRSLKLISSFTMVSLICTVTSVPNQNPNKKKNIYLWKM